MFKRFLLQGSRISTRQCSTLTAEDAYSKLSGVLLVYKPARLSYDKLKTSLAWHLADKLNRLPDPRVPDDFRKLPLYTGWTPNSDQLDLDAVADEDHDIHDDYYSRHPFVIGPRYTPDVVQFFPMFDFPVEYSGIFPVGFGPRGVRIGEAVRDNPTIPRTFRVKGKFGVATADGWDSGRVQERKYCGHISTFRLRQALATLSSIFSRNLKTDFSRNLHDSQRAYELAASGKTSSSMYLVKLNLPHVELEVTVTEEIYHLVDILQRLGKRMKTLGANSNIRFSRWGDKITGKDALLYSECKDISKVLKNIERVTPILEEMYGLPPWGQQLLDRSEDVRLLRKN